MLLHSKYVSMAVGFCVCIIAAAAFLSWSLDVKKQEVLRLLEERIVFLRESLQKDALATEKNQADPLTESLLKDCTDRAAYEQALSRLNAALSRSELTHALTLYNACGDFFALRKRIMASKMKTSLAELTNVEHMYRTYGDSSRYAALLSAWETIVRGETDRANLLSAQVELQGDIIRLLLVDQKADLRDLLTRAQDISQRLDVQSIEIVDQRKKESELWEEFSLAR